MKIFDDLPNDYKIYDKMWQKVRVWDHIFFKMVFKIANKNFGNFYQLFDYVYCTSCTRKLAIKNGFKSIFTRA